MLVLIIQKAGPVAVMLSNSIGQGECTFDDYAALLAVLNLPGEHEIEWPFGSRLIATLLNML